MTLAETVSDKTSILLSVHGLTVSYAAHTVLRDVSFEVARGDLVVVLGPNGAGKTTLLRTIAKVVSPKVGTVLLDGRDIAKLPVRQLMKTLSVVPQSEGSVFSFTVQDIVAMGRTPHLSPLAPLSQKDWQIIREAMEATDVWELKDRLFTELSGGEQRRVLIAKALAQEPQLLLLDEPTANLDLHYQLEVVELIQRLNRERGITVLAVLHDLNLAAMMGQRFILMHRGRIYAVGNADEVLTPQNIQQVYGVPVVVTRHPLNGKPIILLAERRIPSLRGVKVHVVCGGGTGGEVMAMLTAAGCQVTAGALNRGDSDFEAAQLLGVSVVEEQPFMPISREAFERTKEMIANAEVVVLTDVPFGWGNIVNLRAILEAAKGLVVVFNPETIAERDFVNGEASTLLQQIFATKQVVSVHSLSELQRLLVNL
ncbi:heme ABC transporter ATP-binding protein [Fervidibacter sacchari]|uniref:Iron complex transport system ATP-binding protein n=1 Tax=Candidatus Fervidibacter sacchari TaxID=1448929 RepID=A0ABT2EQU8_9BACT|nr:heme ABC transporter ATP-binding protein [Candidatus Fervidibacter sacchari]MCS3920343.1 iron complex transport system ATP-binding protein [Candidatus Fervidibacter sacchari]WKU14697.1 heme ABC transporter ATP-binding protein [Candidatus Fervidibacter sacchari]